MQYSMNLILFLCYFLNIFAFKFLSNHKSHQYLSKLHDVNHFRIKSTTTNHENFSVINLSVIGWNVLRIFGDDRFSVSYSLFKLQQSKSKIL